MDTCKYRLGCAMPMGEHRCRDNYKHCIIYQRKQVLDKNKEDSIEKTFEQIETELFVGSRI